MRESVCALTAWINSSQILLLLALLESITSKV